MNEVRVTPSKVEYETAILTYDGCSCILEFREDYIYLGKLFTAPAYRGNGSASAVLHKAQMIALSEGKPLCLFAGPYADKPKNTEQLVNFYKSRGFKETDGLNLEYEP